MKTLFVSLTILFSTCLSSTRNRLVASTLMTDNENTWGQWSSAIYCNEDTYAIGIKLRVEGKQGGHDDTAGSAFRMICDDNDELNSGNELPWGSWASVRCPSGSFITGFNTKNEARRRLKDDTALNSVKAICSDSKHTIIQPSNAGAWGRWGNENEFRKCADRTSICGFKTRAEKSRGRYDDTGLNAVRMYCCDNPVTFSNVVGRWQKISSLGGGGSISYWYTVGVSKSVQNHVSDSWTKTLTAAAEVSYSFAKASLSAAVAHQVTKTAITSSAKNVEERKVFNCEDGDQAAYQWVTSAKESVMSMTIDFEVSSSDVWCVSDMKLKPECPPEYCDDENCQFYACLPPFGASESVTGKGENYRGYQSFTRSGRQCQKWTSNTYINWYTPADRSNEGLGDHNYCRNPRGYQSAIWCFIDSKKYTWETCTPCDESMTGNGANYRGCRSVTVSGKQCQKWTSQSPHPHWNTPEKSPNKGLGNHNYCRNPDGDKTIWCYTTDPKEQWDFCAANKMSSTFGIYEMIEINVLTSVIVTTIIILCFVCILRHYYSKKGYKKVVYIDEENDV